MIKTKTVKERGRQREVFRGCPASSAFSLSALQQCAKTNKETVIEKTGMCLSLARFYLLSALLLQGKKSSIDFTRN